MADDVREFYPGDKITITTSVDHDANIAGVRAYYRHEDAPEGTGTFLGFEKGATDQQRQQSRDRVLPGPYFEGDVTLENTVQIVHQRPGTYRLDSIIWITAGRRELFAQQIPEDRIRILQEPGDPPNMSRWEVEHS